MSDLPFNSTIFKKLGFDSTNHWLYYDERFSKFFRWVADHVTENNILSTVEVLKIEDMKERQVYLTSHELQHKVNELEYSNAGIFTTTANDVMTLEAEIAAYEEAAVSYESIIEETNVAKNAEGAKLSNLEAENCLLAQEVVYYREECVRKAKKLDQLQADNAQVLQEAYERFAKVQSPALFMCQMPLEEYARKCDSFVYNVEQYVQSQHTFDMLKNDENKLEMMNNIENLQNSLQHYMLESRNEIALAKATKAMHDGMQAIDLDIKSIADLERETIRLERDNEILENTHETLQEQLTLAVNTYASQTLELVLYENNKLKLERAEQRYNIDKQILNIVNDCQRYAELIWIGTQFDLERWRNLTENYNAQQANNEEQNIAKRMKIMRKLPVHDESSVFLKQMTEILSQHLGEQVQPDAKICFYEYSKIMRLYEHNLLKFLVDKRQPHEIARINEM